MSELPQGLGTFAAADLQFAVDDGYSLVPLDGDGGVSIDEQSFDGLLSRMKSGRIPPHAPLASWILARLARITGGSLAIEAETVEVCAGGLYVIDFVVRRGGTPLGKIQLQAGHAGAAILGVVDRSVAGVVVDRFAEALLAEPNALAVCRVRARDPSWPADRIAEYGWDGSAYLIAVLG